MGPVDRKVEAAGELAQKCRGERLSPLAAPPLTEFIRVEHGLAQPHALPAKDRGEKG